MLSFAVLAVGVLLAQSDSKEARRAFDQGKQATRSRKPELAIRHYENAVQTDPAYAEAWFELGRLQAEAQQLDAAKRSLETAIVCKPKLLDAYFALASLAQDASDWNELVRITSALLTIDAVDYPSAWLGNAIGHFNLGRPHDAEKSLRIAVQLDTARRYPQSWQLLGNILADRGDFAGASGQWTEFVRHTPSPALAEKYRSRIADAQRRAGMEALGPEGAATFRAQTELALIRFQVSPKRGRVLTDLRVEDIEIREDGIPQTVALFEGGRFYPRTIPLEITLLFDASGSVQSAGNLNARVFQESLLDEYENASVAIYAFSDTLTRITGPTRHPQVLKKAMDSVSLMPPGITPLFQYITETVRATAVRSGVLRVLIVFSDGESNKDGDTAFYERAIGEAQDAGVAIYPVLLSAPLGASVIPSASVGSRNDSGNAPPKPRLTATSISESIADYLRLGRLTGGEKFQMVSSNDVVPKILKAMARRLQYDYVAGYYPATSAKARRHEAEVVLKARDRGEIVGGKRTVVH